MHGMTLCVPAEFCTKPVSSTPWPLISANGYPQRSNTGIRFWRCSEPKLQCNYIHTLAQIVTLPAGTAAIPTALAHRFNHRHGLSWLSTNLLINGKDPASPPKLGWNAIQSQGYSNTQPKLWSLSSEHLLPGRVLLPDKRFSHRNQLKKSLSISAIKDQEVGAEWWRAVVFHPHETIVLGNCSQLGNLREDLITTMPGLTGTVLHA